MRVGLIDADLLDGGTRFPNLALMKQSAYYKKKGHEVELTDYSKIMKFDKIFLSKVFDYTKISINLDFFNHIEYGGSGFYFDQAPPLDEKIEHHKPDYSLYNNFVEEKLKNGENKNKWKYYLDYDIGFATRGCFRQCDFCINRNCTKVEKHSPIDEFVTKENKYISLLDDNFLGYKNWKNILEELQATKKQFEFKQGLDIRLMTEEKAKMLSESKYKGDYIFAFDDLDNREIIEPKLNLWRKHNNQSTKLYVLVAYKNQGAKDIVEAFERIKILMKYNCLPYLMRYKNYNDSKYRGMYINLARWCNQPSFFKKLSFREFCIKNGLESACYKYMKNFESDHKEIADKYFDIKFKEECK